MTDERKELSNEDTPTAHYIELRDPDGRLACRYDPVRDVIEFQKRGKKFYFDLALKKQE